MFKGTLKRRMLTYGQNTSQDSYMTSWDETVSMNENLIVIRSKTYYAHYLLSTSWSIIIDGVDTLKRLLYNIVLSVIVGLQPYGK